MKRNLLILLILISRIGYVCGQMPLWNLTPNYAFGTTTYLLPLEPTPDANPMNGYDGQIAQKAQNIMTDANNQILFYIVDSYIYDRNGMLIDQMTTEYGMYTVDGCQGQTAIVPIQGTCDEFFIISSTSVSANSVDDGRLHYGRFKIRYLANGQVDPCSGFIPFVDPQNFDESNMIDFISTIQEENPAFDLDLIDQHGGNFRFAVTKEQNGVQRLFVANQKIVLKFLINSTGIIYDGLLDLDVILPSNNGALVQFDLTQYRSEMEVITYNNKFRIGYVISSINADPSNNLNYKGVLVLDVDPGTGNYVANSAKIIKYHYSGITNNDFVKIKGLEFSQNGEYVYVSHSKTLTTSNPSFLSTLDRFNLTVANPSSTLQVISSDLMYKDSHIERIANDQLIIPTQSAMKGISGSSSTVLPTANTLYSLTNYNTVTAWPAASSSEASYARLLQVQIDDYDYIGQFTSTVQCCIDNTTFDKDAYTAAIGNLSWTGGGNPLNNNMGNIVTIKKELRIPAGSNVTITGMTIQFAPGARLIIEHGTNGLQGGKLTLKGTTLTAANLCGTGSMWLGVEVWGNKTLAQGSIGTSFQGRLIMMNNGAINSKIEHAQIGILVSKRPEYYTPGDECQSFPQVSTSGFDDNRNGGIISLSNAKIENNTTGIFFRPYISPTFADNKSSINRSDLTWDDNYRGNTLNYQVYLMKVKGIYLQADNFYNNITSSGIPALFNQGIGILSDNANFYVYSMCNVAIPPGGTCTNYTTSKFKDLRIGITTYNSNHLSYKVNRSEFENCQAGIVSLTTKNQVITENKFKTREISTITPQPTTGQPYGAGIVLSNTKGYKIEQNEFTEVNASNGQSETYGVYLISSGINHNEVYKNTFYSLKVGGGSEQINGSTVPTPGPVTIPTTGLQWICNVFRDPITKADILANKGPIDYHQGYVVNTTIPLAIEGAARNTFSLFGENTVSLPAHDIQIIDPQGVNYVYLNSNSQKPDNVSSVVSTTLQTVTGPVSPTETMCPSKLNAPITGNVLNLLNNKNNLEHQIDGGNTFDLKNTLNNSSDPYEVVSVYSPYLSDEILIDFISSSASDEQKMSILSAQAPLSAMVNEVVQNSSLDQSIKDELVNITGEAPMVKLANEISQATSLFEDAYNTRLSYLYMDTLTTNDTIVNYLSTIGTIDSRKELVNYYTSIKDTLNAFDLMNGMYLDFPDFVRLYIAINKIHEYESLEQALALDAEIVSSLNYLTTNATDVDVKSTAEKMLEVRGAYVQLPTMAEISSSKMYTTNGQIYDDPKLSLLNLYPNPTSGTVNFSSIIELSSIDISVFDLNGREVYTGEFNNVVSGQIDLSQLFKGIYVVQYKLNNSVTETQRIVID